MALQSFLDSWNVTTNGATARTGYGFTPKAGICWTTSRTNGADAVGLASIQASVGIFTSASSRRAVGLSFTHAAATSQVDSGSRADAIIQTITNAGTGALDGLLDITSLDSDGLTPAVDDAFAVDARVHLLAWGGSDIEQATIVTFNQPTATGDLDVTTVGFEPDAVILISALGVGDPPVIVGGGGQLIGFFVRSPTGALQNACVTNRGLDAQTTPHSQGHARGDLCLAVPSTVTGTSIIVRATGTAMLSNGFRLNYAETDSNVRRTFALCIKGGSWHVGSVLSQTGTSEFFSTGMAFEPSGVLFASRMKAEDASDTGSLDGSLSLGCANLQGGSVVQKAHAWFDNDASDPSVCTTAVEYDSCYIRTTETAGTIDGLFGVNRFTGDGFAAQHSDADPNQAFVPFLGWGDMAEPYRTKVPIRRAA